MDNISEIIKRRATPGILIFDMNNRLLYSNETALKIIPDLKSIPKEIYDLCKEKIKNFNKTASAQESIYSVLNTESGICHSMRALLITGFGEYKSIPHIMVLIEGIIEKHRIHFENVKQTFNLTRRELEVLNLICEGCANRKISERLFVSEYTIKDHIKNIMRKMNVNSRNEVIFLCLK